MQPPNRPPLQDGAPALRAEAATAPEDTRPRLIHVLDLFAQFSPDFMADGRGDGEQAERDWRR
ncbi:hypothetical protein BJF92_20210 [Rhizobium rhizosphaerae]|uniref:Uncharacterized protein n=1 Tax=Xaviernesmea rhizosphaerae TaxID=1672749 RepID=A0A1Q9ALF5_9HYPH|nr:hypothetical protein BJF92_20210 [Xaviernesmea rhizosphaerae]